MKRVTVTGSLTNGKALRQSSLMTAEIVNDTAQEVFDQVGAALDVMLKNPTGYYESRITVSRVRGSDAVVHDQGVVYGPWLAGVSSRNNASRFKGYAHWRRATQLTQAKVVQIAAPSIRKHVKVMNR